MTHGAGTGKCCCLSQFTRPSRRAQRVLIDQRGPIVGLGTQKPFGQQTVPLHSGDKVLLYTDGLLESRNPAGEYFGKSRFYDILKKYRREPVQAIVNITYEKIKAFRRQAAPFDDISLLGVEYRGGGGHHYII